MITKQTHALLKLALLPGIGPRTMADLLDTFGDAEGVWSATPQQLSSVPGVGKKLLHTIESAEDFVDVESTLRWCNENGTRVVTYRDDDYPMPLKELSDAPPLLFVRGSLLETDQLSVAIVGTRHATAYGLRQAERLAFGLAQAGVTVVSGLARGIDTSAHKGALDGGGRSIAFLGGGLARMYPPENARLADRCEESGAVISEQAPAARPAAGMFPQRNRLIAALTLATLVIEAPERSGSLITARMAMENDREVMALPGQVTSRASKGCHSLIRDGATLVTCVDDVLESIGPMRQPISVRSADKVNQVRHPAELNLNDVEQTILQAIAPESTSIDQVIAITELPAHRVMATLSVLELKKLIRRLSGQYVARV